MGGLTVFLVTPTLFGSWSANGTEFSNENEARSHAAFINTSECFSAISDFYTVARSPVTQYKTNGNFNGDLRKRILSTVHDIMTGIKLDQVIYQSYLDYLLDFIPRFYAAVADNSEAKRQMQISYYIVDAYSRRYKDVVRPNIDLDSIS